MKFAVHQLSRQGGREKNEDRMGYSYTREAVLLVVADGMGGHPKGEVAAQLAVQTVSDLFHRQAQPALTNVAGFLSEALMAAHQAIVDHGNQHAMLDNPRTTLVVAVIQSGYVQWIHSGDSRIYLVRQGKLLQRSRDHSYAEKHIMIRGQADPMNRNILFTCLGSPVAPLFDVSDPIFLHEGDRVLLCSDGLWSELSDEHIAEQLALGRVQDAVPLLVDEALERGGAHGDNVTVLALDWETPGDFEPTHMISTEGVSDGVFASTIQAAGNIDASLDDFDDAAIERSIAEINEAIRRSSARKGSNP